MPRILLTITALTTAIALAAGCGNDGASSSGAASLAPAGSLVYGEATLRPEGDQKAAIDELVAKFPGEGSAGDRIGQLMEQAFAESDSGLSYQADIEPWLGDEAAFFVSSIDAGGEDADAAVLVATDDEDATVDAVEKDRDVSKTDHRGHDMYVSSDEEGAAAVVDGWLVLGNPGGVRTAIDTVEDGETIEDDERYEETLDGAPEDRLGFVYVNTPGFLRELQGMPGAAALGQFRQVFEEPVLVTANADEAGARFEATVPASLMRAFPIVAEGSGAAGELPADSWLAFAQPELGQTIDGYLDLVGGAVGGRDVIQQQLEMTTGLDLEEDVISWMGDWGAFVRGTSVPELDGAVFIETKDEAASGRFIDAIARLAREHAEPGMRILPLQLDGGGEGVTARSPDLPQPVHLFQRDGKVVAAYGDAAARDAVDPAETLAGSPAYTQAEEALGGDYAISFFLAIEPILALAESEGASSDEDFQKAKPYLEPLGALVGGARKDGDKLRSAFGLTVK
ncbi:MAG TPA: DUF3352 domain-containing protein [Thermoleophilaceae bacterium]|nr:DUF3352 domain-containing protein [Thermoleophilaceae bacterium]